MNPNIAQHFDAIEVLLIQSHVIISGKWLYEKYPQLMENYALKWH